MARAKRTHVSRTIVEVVTDDGTVGLGETRVEWSAGIIRERSTPRLIGHPIADRQAARALCLPPYLDYGFPELGVRILVAAGATAANAGHGMDGSSPPRPPD